MTAMPDDPADCRNCDWSGKYTDLELKGSSSVSRTRVCPNCGVRTEWIDVG